jgi:hypothetical protein
LLLEVKRLWYGPENAEFRASSTGTLSLDGEQVCFTLEPTALMVPPGAYAVKLQWSERLGRIAPHLDVPGRSGILIHGGNRATDSEGCILVADNRIDAYTIYESQPAIDAIEEALDAAEANSEQSTVSIS